MPDRLAMSDALSKATRKSIPSLHINSEYASPPMPQVWQKYNPAFSPSVDITADLRESS